MVSIIRKLSAVLAGTCLVGLVGCASKPTEFAWSHTASGEYLFAYDTQACEAASAPEQGAKPANATAPFFSCMRERGYFLIDPVSGLPVDPDVFSAEDALAQQALR